MSITSMIANARTNTTIPTITEKVIPMKTYAQKSGAKRALVNQGLDATKFEFVQVDGRWIAKELNEFFGEDNKADDVIQETPVTKKMNAQAKASSITQELYRKGDLSEAQSVMLAVAFMHNEDLLNLSRPDAWKRKMTNDLYNMTLIATKEEETVLETTDCEWTYDWFSLLQSADLVTAEGDAGKYLDILNTLKPKAFARTGEEGITKANRRKSICKNGVKASKLSYKAMNFSQKQLRTIDESMLNMAVHVFEGIHCEEQYVIDGASHQMKLGNVPSVMEYFFDTRFRIYQGDSHGGNVQASDMARSFLSPCGVTRKYNAKAALKVLVAEAKDMIKNDTDEGVKRAIAALTKMGGIEFIKAAIKTDDEGKPANKVGDAIKKPWSFVKIAKLITELQAGNKPYLNVTVGLDAKCSGPQLGALLVGEEGLAAACGFSKKEVNDAYMICMDMLERAGFMGLTRNLMKTPYMGVFYGQSSLAFALLSNYGGEGKGQHDLDLLPVMMSVGPDLEENAKKFHKIVEKSFGSKLVAIRKALKGMHFHYEKTEQDAPAERVMHTDQPTSYFLPDGQEVATQYFIRHDILGQEIMGKLDKAPTVTCTIGTLEFKFIEMSFKTKEYALYDYARTGFVNFIQSMDGLLARLIITKLETLGASHCDAVHDCFRVTVPDMIEGKLHKAIEWAYSRLFGGEQDYKCQELPMGQDAMLMYFEGVNRACTEEYKYKGNSLKKAVSQFEFDVASGEYIRNLHMNGMDIMGLIKGLKNDLEETGESYYFAK